MKKILIYIGIWAIICLLPIILFSISLKETSITLIIAYFLFCMESGALAGIIIGKVMDK